MTDTYSRRDFLNVTAGAGAYATLASSPHLARDGQAGACRLPPFEAVRPGLVRHADALGAADAGRERSRPLRSAVLARLLPPHPRRRRLPERRRHRRLLPDRGAAAPSQRMARVERSVRDAGCRAAARWGCTSSRAPIRTPRATRCGPRIRTGLPSTPDGQPDPALGEPGPVGDLRARALQLRVHGPGPSRDRHASTRSTASSRTAGRRRRSATACTASRTSRRRPGWICRTSTDAADPARRAVHRVAQGAADRAVEARGTRPSARPTPTRASSRTARPT